MNWLAHLLLSDPTPDAQLGGVLADVVKARTWPGMSEEFRAGIARHRRVDAFTDAHPVFAASRQRLGESGSLRGVVVDLVYDHMLSRHWDAFSGEPLRASVDWFYAEAQARMPDYPEDAQRFVQALVASDLLGSYGTLDGLAAALQRIDRRLRNKGWDLLGASAYLPVISEKYSDLEQDFLAFFPAVLAFVAAEANPTTC